MANIVEELIVLENSELCSIYQNEMVVLDDETSKIKKVKHLLDIKYDKCKDVSHQKVF